MSALFMMVFSTRGTWLGTQWPLNKYLLSESLKIFKPVLPGHLGLLLSEFSLLLSVGCYSLPFLRGFLQIVLELQVSILPSTRSCIDLLGNKSPLK